MRQRQIYSLVDYVPILLSMLYLFDESLFRCGVGDCGPPSRFSTVMERALIRQMIEIMTKSQGCHD